MTMMTTNYSWSRYALLAQLRFWISMQCENKKRTIHQNRIFYPVCANAFFGELKLVEKCWNKIPFWFSVSVVIVGRTKYMRVQFWHFRFCLQCEIDTVLLMGGQACSIKITAGEKMPTQNPFLIGTKLNWRNSLCNPKLNRLFTLKFMTEKILTQFQSTISNLLFIITNLVCVCVGYIFENDRDPSTF